MTEGRQESPEQPADVVRDAVARWRRRLLELAGGSALWDVDSLGDALVDLSAAHPSGIAQLLSGRTTRLSNLAREGSALTHARRRARVVGARTEELAQRYGFAPTYVAMGVASWDVPAPGTDESAGDGAAGLDDRDGAEDGDRRRVHVPVLLRPVRLTVRTADAEVELQLDPAVELNAVLVRELRRRGARVDVDALVASTHAAHGFTPRPVLEEITTLGERMLPGFSLEPRIVLGAFVHPGQSLAEDLDAARLAGHDVVRALAGDEDARRRLGRPLPATRAADPAPDTERGVGDLDAGQHRVLDAVAGGGHLFVDAPPGVDVPATVAAVVAQAAAEGKRVLYVPGTRRAGQAVRAAMVSAGVDGLVLDLGDDARWRSTAARRVVDGMDPTPEQVEDAAVRADRSALLQARTALSEFVEALHRRREPWGASAYEAMQELAELTSQRPGPRTQVRLDGEAMRDLGPERRQQAREELAHAAALGAFRLRASDTPWYGARLRGAAHAREIFERVGRLAATMPTLQAQMSAAASQTGLDEPATLRHWSEQLDLLEGIRSSLDVFTPQVFERSADDMVAATASSGWREQRGADLSWAERGRLRKQARDLLRPGVSVPDLHTELLAVQARRELWRRHCAGGGWPRLPEGLTTILQTEQEVAADVEGLQETLSPTVGDADLRDLPVAELADRLARLGADDATVRQMPERAGVLGSLEELGLQPLVADLTMRRVPTGLVGAEFDLAWWSSLLEEILTVDPQLAGLDATSLEVASERLRDLDARQTASLAAPVRNRVRDHVRAVIATDKPAARELYRQVVGGAADLRELTQRFGDIAWAPRPVWIVPPMVVPQVVGPGPVVDLVVLDAVQHLPTEQAVAAVSRARQVVVVGDSRRGGAGFAQDATVLPRLELPGDRLDLDAEIAGFLAAHGYDGVIHPVPAPERALPPQILLDLVAGTGMPGRAEAVESVQAEVDRVVDLVIEHALTRPESSLAVIGLNAAHVDRVRDAVLSTAASSSMAAFVDPERPEPFTVVDLESTAGLRRDAIILTVGYGKTPHGRVLYRFGAVAGEHGHALLVDGLDACRHRLTVVSCLAAEDLDPDRLRTPGGAMLRDLLAFARDGGTAPAAAPEPPASDRLVRDLAERLERLGLHVVTRYGAPGGVRVPIAVGHPSVPGQLLLAVLTDEPDYVAEPSLRARDRHWVQRLENRGWHVRTVFSTAVFMDPQGEAERIRDRLVELITERNGSVAVPERHVRPPAVVVEDVADDVDESVMPLADQAADDVDPGTDTGTGESTDARAGREPVADPEVGADADGPTRRSRRSRRAVRPGSERAGDDVLAWEDDDRAWGEGAGTSDDGAERLLRDVPPHWA